MERVISVTFLSFSKTAFAKTPINELQCRNYRRFEIGLFLQENENLSATAIYIKWEKTLVKTSNSFLPLKQIDFTKDLRKI